jgi:hypothetical protein
VRRWRRNGCSNISKAPPRASKIVMGSGRQGLPRAITRAVRREVLSCLSVHAHSSKVT